MGSHTPNVQGTHKPLHFSDAVEEQLNKPATRLLVMCHENHEFVRVQIKEKLGLVGVPSQRRAAHAATFTTQAQHRAYSQARPANEGVGENHAHGATSRAILSAKGPARRFSRDFSTHAFAENTSLAGCRGQRQQQHPQHL
jgi:hypothetical protein